MTIFFPDVSSYTPNVNTGAYPVILARATLSASVTDTSYASYKQRAASTNTVFVAYHWLNHGNLAAQAAHCYAVVGRGVPLMIDAEDEPGNTGYAGPLTVADIIGFASQFRALGGTVSLAYVPNWYWSGAMGAPDLTPLTRAGLHLVSSNYPSSGYSENGPGWAAYGGVAPVQWQYTDTPIDLNAYRGTVADYVQMLGGQQMVDFTPSDPNAWTEATRIAAMFAMSDTSQPNAANSAGEPAAMVAAIKNILSVVNGLSVPAPAPVDPAALKAVLLDPQVLAAIAKAVNDDTAARLRS